MRENNRNGFKWSNSQRKITVINIFFILCLLVVLYRLFTIQILDSSKYQIAARKQYESKILLKPSRGIIFDRKMNALVSNVNMYSFGADPNMVDDKDSVAAVFSRIFSKDKNFYLDKLNTKNTSFVWLERRIDPKYEELVKDINFPGVIKLNEPNRISNYNGVASQIAGMTNIDNSGISGVELGFNESLSGIPGYVIMQKDGLGRKRPAVEYPRSEPVDGNNVILTIDLNIQKILEEELSYAVNINNASGGKVVVMNVKTGEILGMYSLSFDGSSADKIGVISDLYEPGSTFKIVTAAASIEENLMNMMDVINTYGGEYMNIKDAHRFSKLSFRQVIEQSSNVGIIQIARRLGQEKFYKYVRDFGYGINTGIDLPGEMKGRLKKPVEFSPVSMNYMSIGYEILVNTMQMTNAYACVANGGTLMKPYVVKKVLSPDGKLIHENRPTEIRKVISPRTAKTLTELLVGVVERGTGRDAKIEGMKIAGKTGTSQKFIDGNYSKSQYTSSFIGYFPAENPVLVISVIIDAPSAGEYYGGKVSAPVFRRIAERIINLTGLHEYSVPETDNLTQMQDESIVLSEEFINLVNFDVEDALNILKEKNIKFEIEGPQKNGIVTEQKKLTGPSGDSGIKLVTSAGYNSKDLKLMPDFKGMSLRKCLKVLSSLGVEYRVEGFGRVIAQFPEAGSEIGNNTVVIKCERK
ncbi:MAG: penicillin-binding transpeptidase domain-containing protein [Ignavibacteria bacterium]|nr:penicillin-binding transpeptidase domain-containing protein [Ignavibacteria bacterium]